MLIASGVQLRRHGHVAEKGFPVRRDDIYCGFFSGALIRTVTAQLVIEVDATGRDCPMPLLMAKRALNGMQSGQRLRVLATDRGSVRDFRVFAEQSGHRLLESEVSDGVYRYLLEKR